jgi:molybdenum cofactor biosynthesis enzyme MoaA
MINEIGFYTLSDIRAKNIGPTSPMQRCEIIITDACNFKCLYCRGQHFGVMPLDKITSIIDIWAKDNLQNIRFSGGEPTTHKHLIEAVEHAKNNGIKRIAISTNGSMPFEWYKNLIKAGVNDFSISLDACCSSGCDAMAGTSGFFETIRDNIKKLSELTYVTVGIVVTNKNLDAVNETIKFAHDLGVADIRVISAAQYNKLLECVTAIPKDILDAHPILKYRVNNIKNGRNVRGLRKDDTNRCHLVQDDSAVAGDFHFPCIIYLREQGEPIGKIGPNMRADRVKWFESHDTHKDPICSKNCLDVCIDFNNRCENVLDN